MIVTSQEKILRRVKTSEVVRIRELHTYHQLLIRSKPQIKSQNTDLNPNTNHRAQNTKTKFPEAARMEACFKEANLLTNTKIE